MSDRKYRQKGYQDAERARAPAAKSSKSEARPQPEGPRGRGLGRPERTVFRCRDCGQAVADPSDVGPAVSCRRCNAALHACVNCAHFDPNSRNECRQPVPARIASKTRANECELYTPKLVAELGDGPGGDGGGRRDDPRAAFDALFK